MQYHSSLPVRMRWRKRAFYWCYAAVMLVAALLISLTPSFAQTPTPNVKLSAHSLLQGHFKYGDWLPISVELENYGAAIDVRIQTTVVARSSGSTFTTTYERETNLGERANKQLTLYIIPYVETTNPSRSVVYDTTLVLMTGNQKLDEKKVDLQPNQPTDYLVGAITQDPNALLSLNNLKLGGMRYLVTSIGLNLSDIPDRSNGLHSLNALVMEQINTEALSKVQRDTIREWVEAGGQLILLGGNGWSRVRSGFINSDLLPLEVNNYSNISTLNGLVGPNGEAQNISEPLAHPVTVARGQVIKDSRLLSYLPDGSNIIPLIAEKQIGAGRVLAVSLDLAQTPLSDWSGTTQLWQQILNFNTNNFIQLYSENNPQIRNASDFLGYVSNVNGLRLPEIMPFFEILFIYLIVVAPLNYLTLKKLAHLELAWLTTPLVSVVFGFIALNYANSQPPGQVLISQMSVVQSSTDQESAQVRSYAALFSPEERRYNIEPNFQETFNQAKTLITPLFRVSSNGGEDTNRVVVQSEGARLEGFSVGQWNAQGFAMETQLPSKPYQLITDLHYEGNKIVGTIKNSTNSPLRNGMLVLGEQVIRVRDVIEVGEILPVDFDLPLPTAAVASYCTSYSGGTTYTNNSPAEKIVMAFQQDRRDDKIIANQANFLKKLYESGRYSPINTRRGFDFIGWMDQNPIPLNINGVTSESKSSQVLIARLKVNPATSSGDGHLLLPSMAFWPETAFSSTGQFPFTNRTDHTDQLCVAARSNVTVQYQLPLEQGTFKVKKLTLYLNSFATTGPRKDPTLPDTMEFYNFQTRNWQSVPGLLNSAVPVLTGSNFSSPPIPVKNVIEDAARFVDPNTGRVLIKISSAASGLFVQQGLEVEGSQN